jgi:transcriptional regulator with XRE-family HTH domain
VIVRIGEVIGERVRTARDGLGWTQTELGKRIGARLGQRAWSRQIVSAAEQGKRAYTAAELLAFANELDVSISYLLTPPLGVEAVEMAPGVNEHSTTILKAVFPRSSRSAADEKFAESGQRFFQHVADLHQLTVQIQGDIEALVTDLQVVHAERGDESWPSASGERES